jgi:hypothetical protein
MAFRSGSASRWARAIRRRSRMTETIPRIATNKANPAGTRNALNVSIAKLPVRGHSLSISSRRFNEYADNIDDDTRNQNVNRYAQGEGLAPILSRQIVEGEEDCRQYCYFAESFGRHLRDSSLSHRASCLASLPTKCEVSLTASFQLPSYGALPTETSTRYGVSRSYTKPSTTTGFDGFAAAALASCVRSFWSPTTSNRLLKIR